jgi:hypothetical protein
MSPRAACRLATLGFSRTYDYAAGKVDWMARNLSVEGSDADRDTIGRHLRRDVVTVWIADPIGEVRDRVAHSAHRFALVTTEGGILLGRLGGGTSMTPIPPRGRRGDGARTVHTAPARTRRRCPDPPRGQGPSDNLRPP